MLDYKIISCDDHMDMPAWPPRLFQDRLTGKLREKAPRVEQMPEGNFWVVEGQKSVMSGMLRDAGTPNAWSRAGIKNNDGFRPSTPRSRLEDMDLDGVYASVIYGPPAFPRIADQEVKLACIRAFNDWAIEFNSADRDRLSVLAYLPLTSPKDATEELIRCAKKGHKGAVFGFVEAPKPIFDPGWETLWSAVEEVGVPLSIHISGGLSSLPTIPGSWAIAATASCWPKNLDEPLAGMMFSGGFERHPRLTMVMGESGLGWIPYMVERMDLVYKKYYDSIKDFRLKRKPSEYFRQQVYVTFEAEEDVGMRLIPEIGVDRVMWASDYPHPDSTFPNSRKLAETMFTKIGLDPVSTRKIVRENAAALYKIKGLSTN